MKPIRMIPVLLSLLLLGGCTFPSGDDLLAAPRPSTNYQTLQAELDELIASGVSYTAPIEGENRSSIQLVDLDNDGVEEAIAFFRGSTSATSNTFQIYVYKRQGDQYVAAGSVEGQGTAIQSVDYPAITPDGRCGMVITWRLTGDGAGCAARDRVFRHGADRHDRRRRARPAADYQQSRRAACGAAVSI